MHLLPHIQRELGAWGTSHRFVIIGDGPMEAELRARCPDAVFFGLQPEDEVASTLASSDVLLFAGSVELPVCAVIQAQACGIPVVVADAGGAHEEMRPGLSGLIARGSTPAEFADAIRRLVRDRDLVAPDERSSARVRVDATLAGCRQTTCHRIAGRGPTARRLGIAAFGPVDQDTVTPAATLDARPYRVAPSAPSSFVFDPVTATSSGVDTLARMVERLMSVTCPRCCRSGILVMGATFAGPREQRWRCRWCGQPNRARVDAVIVRAFKRANTPSGQLLITEPWRRGYLREPLARDVQGSA